MVCGHVHGTGQCPRLTDDETPLKSFSQSGARMSAVFTRAGGTYRVTVVERASSWRGAHELRRTSESIECKYVRRELRQLKRGDLDALPRGDVGDPSAVDGGCRKKYGTKFRMCTCGWLQRWL